MRRGLPGLATRRVGRGVAGLIRHARWLPIAALVIGCGGGDSARLRGDLTILDAPVQGLALVLASDHGSGAYAVVDPERQAAVTHVELTHGDARLRVIDGRGFVINRLNADNVQVVDPSERFATTSQWSVGPGSNPADLTLSTDGALAFVPLYERSHIAVHDADGGELVTTIPLEGYADLDGLPEPSGVVTAPNGRILSPLQRLDRNDAWLPVGPALLLAIDPSTFEVAAERELRVVNPAEPLRLVPGLDAFVVVGMGAYFEVDGGGVEWVSASPPYDSEWIAGEEEFGGSTTNATTADGDTFFVVANHPRDDAGADGFAQDTVLYRYVATTGVRTEVLATDGFHIADICLASGVGTTTLLLVADRTPERPGIRVFDADTLEERTSAPIDTGLPPLRIAPLDQGS